MMPEPTMDDKADMDGMQYDANGIKPPEPKSNGMEVPVPLEALASPGEDDQMTSPQVGDPVSLYAEGKLVRIEGQHGIVAIDNVNGKPLDAQAAKTANTPEDDENGEKPEDDGDFEQLKTMAAMQPPR
jgi:hypothetical protein